MKTGGYSPIHREELPPPPRITKPVEESKLQAAKILLSIAEDIEIPIDKRIDACRILMGK
jgi:hypothetical protein